LQPDVLVARRSEVGRQRLENPPLLVVEVLSPSSRMIDRTLKRAVYEEFGVQHYWIVDPAVPVVTALALLGPSFDEVGRASGSEPFELDEPFPVRLVPQDLLDE
jgi:Uma2 family endonuclease